MPRRDLTEERTKQILDAFERCIVRFGLEGSSLERIGEEAGMKRPILRHYIGNREELIRALCERIILRWKEELRLLRSAPPGENRKETLVQYLFEDMEEWGASDTILVAENLIASAEQYPFIGKMLRKYVCDFTEMIAARLKIVSPASDRLERWEVAYGITSILFNELSLGSLRLPRKYSKAARACVSRLIENLG